MISSAITNVLLQNIRDWNLYLSKWRRDGFDGAATISGHVSGVSTKLWIPCLGQNIRHIVVVIV